MIFQPGDKVRLSESGLAINREIREAFTDSFGIIVAQESIQRSWKSWRVAWDSSCSWSTHITSWQEHHLTRAHQCPICDKCFDKKRDYICDECRWGF